MNLMHLKQLLRTTALRTSAIGSAVAIAVIACTLTPVQVANADQTTEPVMQMTSSPEVVYSNSIDTQSRTIDFNSKWKFLLSDSVDAHTVAFDDSKWRLLSLPHDFSIEQDFNPNLEAESGYLPGGTGWYRKSFTLAPDMAGKRVRINFDGVYMHATVWLNNVKLGQHHYGYSPFSFDLTDHLNLSGENVLVVKAENKMFSSRWYSGSGIYRQVSLTVTDPLHIATNGVVAKTPDLQAQQSGTVSMQLASKVSYDNVADGKARSFTLRHTIFPKGGLATESLGSVTTDATELTTGRSTVVNATLPVSSPKLWSVENPNLYTVRTEVLEGDEVVDTYDIDYGFRYFRFDTEQGFFLNDKAVKLKGVSMHHDQGSLGAISNERAVERQLEILKDMGVNSVRVTHNPASKALVDAANQMGVLLIEEAYDTWLLPKNYNSEDFSKWIQREIGEDNSIEDGAADMTWGQFDLQAMIKRDINAPSVIMWSLGNEVLEGISGDASQYPNFASKLIRWTQDLDTTRPVTIGDNKLKSNVAMAIQIDELIHQANGIVGANYMDGRGYDSTHARYGHWALYGSETASAINSRGIYNSLSGGRRTADKQLTSYDRSAVGWGHVASHALYDTMTRDFLAGEYVWTGFDYIGEPTPWNGVSRGKQGSWPSPKNSYFGIIDTAGLPKDSYYLYRSVWNDDSTTLHILPAWNENVVYKGSNNNVLVNVYSNAASVELFITGQDGQRRSLGKKALTEHRTPAGHVYRLYEGADKDTTAHRNLYLSWNVPFEAGTLEAVAYDSSGAVISETVGRSSVSTTGASNKLSAKADRKNINADGKDLSYITVDVTDENSNIVPDAANRVKFDITGPATLVGVDNGDSADHDSYKADNRKAFRGKVLAIVQSTKEAGQITVTASADGLKSSTVTLNSTADSKGSKSTEVDSFRFSRHYYVLVGNKPKLPQTIETRYTDGTLKQEPVQWNEILPEQINQRGTFSLEGVVAKQKVSVNITMIENIGAILNYSTATAKSTVPVLPTHRPAVMPDGTILDVMFKVDWQMPAQSVWNDSGTVTVNGTTNVFGKDMPVTATVRVQEENISIGSSVSKDVLKLTQDIPENKQSETLAAVADGSTTITRAPMGQPNPSFWTNCKYSQSGNNKASITFEYATQLRLGQVLVHFLDDSNRIRVPAVGTTKIEVSDDGSTYKTLDVQENMGRKKAYSVIDTFDFTPALATFVRLTFTNKDIVLEDAKPCVGISEIELRPAQGRYEVHDGADLDSVNVNGLEVPESTLPLGSYQTPALKADVTATSKDNASVTILPAHNDVIRIITESEDHNLRKVFEVQLNTTEPDHPAYAGRDIPTDQLTASAGAAQQGNAQEGPASFALDNNTQTLWHTSWRPLATRDKLWIAFDLNKPTTVDALRYLPRSGSLNGVIKDYRVEASNDGQQWEEISTGSWSSEGGWKLAKFDPITTQHLRLYAVNTYGDGAHNLNKYASASEMRVRSAVATTSIANQDNNVTVTVPESIAVPKVNQDKPAEFNISDIVLTDNSNQNQLVYGVDYLLNYSNNTDFGTGHLSIKGIGKYSGVVEHEFQIHQRDPVLLGIALKPESEVLSNYTQGDLFNPSGIVLVLTYDDDSVAEVVYDAKDGNFAFTPTLDTALTPEHQQVTVSYLGKQTAIDITVMQTPSYSDDTQNSPTPSTLTDEPVPTPDSDVISTSGVKTDDTSAKDTPAKAKKATIKLQKLTEQLPVTGTAVTFILALIVVLAFIGVGLVAQNKTKK